MKIQEMYDVSRRLKNGLAQYPGDLSFNVQITNDYHEGYLNSAISMSAHTATHVDAPAHINKHGKQIEEMDLHNFVGGCLLIEVSGKSHIDYEDIKDIDIAENEIVLFKTDNSNLSLDDGFKEDYVYLSDAACRHLVNIGVKTVGIDYLSVDRYMCNTAHEILLNSNISIIEGLCFKNINPGEYYISALPLKLHNCEASPVRAVLFKLK